MEGQPAAHHVWEVSHAQRDALRASERATRLIRELAENQHGVVARRQLLDRGLGSGLIRDRVRAGRLIPLHRGVFALGHRRIGLRGEWMAAALAAGPRAVLSHRSAAHLWGLRNSRGAIEVTRSSGGGSRVGIRIHQAALPSTDVTIEEGIPVTSVERTLVDISATLDKRQIERAIAAADRAGCLRWSRLAQLLDRSSGRLGIARLRRVLTTVDPRVAETRSPLEVDFLALCQRAGLPAPAINVLVEDHLVDFLWPAERVIVETDGYRYHRDRAAFERDHESTAALMAAGYTVHRLTYRMVQHAPQQVIALLRRSLTNRASNFGRDAAQT